MTPDGLCPDCLGPLDHQVGSHCRHVHSLVRHVREFEQLGHMTALQTVVGDEVIATVTGWSGQAPVSRELLRRDPGPERDPRRWEGDDS
jgi:hypothetical protein